MAFSKNKTHSFIVSSFIGSHRSNPRIPPSSLSESNKFRSISVETMVVHGWTGVFWDMDEFPLPPGLDVDQFVENVKLAISNEGAHGHVEFFAYGSSDSFDYGRYLESMSFTPAKVVDKRPRFYRLLHSMLNWVHKRQRFGGQKNLLVIAKAMPGQDNITMINFLDEMIVRGHNVFTVVPEGCSPENFDYPEPILAWEWLALCSGNRSIDLSSAYPTDDDDSGPETDRAQGVKRASETDAAGSARKRLQKDAANSQD